jgi:hypothetical protein
MFGKRSRVDTAHDKRATAKQALADAENNLAYLRQRTAAAALGFLDAADPQAAAQPYRDEEKRGEEAVVNCRTMLAAAEAEVTAAELEAAEKIGEARKHEITSCLDKLDKASIQLDGAIHKVVEAFQGMGACDPLMAALPQRWRVDFSALSLGNLQELVTLELFRQGLEDGGIRVMQDQPAIAGMYSRRQDARITPMTDIVGSQTTAVRARLAATPALSLVPVGMRPVKKDAA